MLTVPAISQPCRTNSLAIGINKAHAGSIASTLLKCQRLRAQDSHPHQLQDIGPGRFDRP
jgi:hypothetical protein